MTVTFPLLGFAFAICTSVLNSFWKLVISVDLFLSVCLVTVFLLVCRDILIVVVVGDKKEREEREDS